MKLLHIDSSILGSNSASRALTAEVVAAWCEAHADVQVEYLDLAEHAPEHFSAAALGVKVGHSGERTAEQVRQDAISERLLTQFLAADVIVIGAPLYNFDIPSQLKAWIDRLAQPGRTFRYTENGPVGLAGDKTVIVVSTRGGKYAETPEPGQLVPREREFMRLMFGFMGVTDVRLVCAEGLAMGEAARAAGLAQARRDIVTAVGVGAVSA